jgi:hypothetical protein
MRPCVTYRRNFTSHHRSVSLTGMPAAPTADDHNRYQKSPCPTIPFINAVYIESVASSAVDATDAADVQRRSIYQSTTVTSNALQRLYLLLAIVLINTSNCNESAPRIVRPRSVPI